VTAGSKPSVLFWVQHLLGIGHLQRTLRLADALVEQGIAVTVASGGMPQPLRRNPEVALVQLPPLRARDASFALIDDVGAPLDDRLRQRRRDALLAVLAASRPDAVILEGFPFARRAFRFELDPLIAMSRAAGWRPSILCSVRDIVVVHDDTLRHREIVERVRHDIDRVLVHGDPALIPFEASFPLASEIADRLVYTGYVAQYYNPPRQAGEGRGGVGAEAETQTASSGEILVSAGGGAVGRALLEAALAARRAGCFAHLPWRLITGTNLPEADIAALRAGASSGVAIERFRHDFPALLRACRVSVSQAGYNTVLDLLSARVRAVLVPFAAGRETEQTQRAEHLAALGAAELVREGDLSAATLAAAIERAAARSPPNLAIDTGGAVRSARLIAEMIGSGDAAADGFAAPASRELTADWSDLVTELDCWGEAGRVASLWWRDDDTVTATPELAGLRRIAGDTPLALAVIPAPATASLAGALHGTQSIRVLQHGWHHANRATAGKKSEYPSGLSASVVAAEVITGSERLALLFGKRALPVFVPPWNRIAPELLPILAANGITVLSTIASSKISASPTVMPKGLARIDTHVDLTDWKNGKRFIGTAVALGALVFWLRRCRLGDMAGYRPIGILTHHMIMDGETAVFLEGLIRVVAGHRAARWVDIAELVS
jgi:predicted glycosyltransferase